MARDVVLIYARAANGVIGDGGGLPWRIPADLKRFKALTLGQDGLGRPMIMGRKTFESLGRLLPGRRHIVLTRSRDWQAEGAEVAHTTEAALALAGDGEVSVIGGAEVFALFATLATRIEHTEIHADIAGDTFMPAPGPEWRETGREEHPPQDDMPAYAFVTLVRA